MQIWTNSAVNPGMVIDTSGNVGIGTTSPGTELHIFGSSDMLHLEAGNTGFAELQISDGSNYLQMGIDSDSGGRMNNVGANEGYVGTYSSQKMHIVANNAAKLTIDTSGNIGICK